MRDGGDVTGVAPVKMMTRAKAARILDEFCAAIENNQTLPWCVASTGHDPLHDAWMQCRNPYLMNRLLMLLNLASWLDIVGFTRESAWCRRLRKRHRMTIQLALRAVTAKT